jgi:hypothetical protein
MDRANR